MPCQTVNEKCTKECIDACCILTTTKPTGTGLLPTADYSGSFHDTGKKV